MNKLVVLTDLGTFKAFRLEKDPLSSTPRLQPVDSMSIAEGDDRIGRFVTDQAGQFTKNAPSFVASSDQANGEPHNLWLENERRSMKQIARKMSELLSNGQFESCYFAAASEINHSILDHLAPDIRSKIEKNLRCNLVNAKKDDIIHRFQN